MNTEIHTFKPSSISTESQWKTVLDIAKQKSQAIPFGFSADVVHFNGGKSRLKLIAPNQLLMSNSLLKSGSPLAVSSTEKGIKVDLHFFPVNNRRTKSNVYNESAITNEEGIAFFELTNVPALAVGPHVAIVHRHDTQEPALESAGLLVNVQKLKKVALFKHDCGQIISSGAITYMQDEILKYIGMGHGKDGIHVLAANFVSANGKSTDTSIVKQIPLQQAKGALFVQFP